MGVCFGRFCFGRSVLGVGTVAGTLVAAFLGDRLGGRLAYVLLCLLSLATIARLFRFHTVYDAQNLFMFITFLLGACTASFCGWLPLCLPELFGTAIRATSQSFSFNFGRIIAAIGELQVGYLVKSQ